MNRDKLIIILGAALFLSLSVNLFMAGIMLGRSYNHGPAAEHEQEKNAPRAEWQKRDEELRRQLSESDRNILKGAMQQRRPQFQALRQAVEEAHQKVVDAQTAEPFDKAALDTALHDESEKKTALVQTLRQARDEIGSQLSPEGRAVFSKLGPGSRMGGGGGRRNGEGGGPDRPNGPNGFNGPNGGSNGGPPGPLGGPGPDGPPPGGAFPPNGGQNSPVPQP